MRTTSLAAILFCELAGFNELLGRDEAKAISLLKAYRDLVDPLIEEHGGELVDATGDELLIVFGSAVGAVQCALHLRLSERSLTRGRPAQERLSPRSGIHLGEIWRDGTRVYGNGVNVAARIKAEAGPGQILLSEDVYRQVVNKLDLPMRTLPDRPLKNIERSLAIYEILDASQAEAPAAAGIAGSGAGAGNAAATETAAPRPPAPPAPPVMSPSAETGGGGTSPARADARAALARALAKGVSEAARAAAEKAKAAAERGDITIEGEPGTDLDITINVEPANGSPSSGPGDIEARMDKARKEMSKGFRGFLLAAAITAGFAYFWLPSRSFWLLAGGALFGLGPALSNLKRLVKGAFDLSDAKKDARRLEDDRG